MRHGRRPRGEGSRHINCIRRKAQYRGCDRACPRRIVRFGSAGQEIFRTEAYRSCEEATGRTVGKLVEIDHIFFNVAVD